MIHIIKLLLLKKPLKIHNIRKDAINKAISAKKWGLILDVL